MILLTYCDIIINIISNIAAVIYSQPIKRDN